MRYQALAIFSLLLCLSMASATTWYVDPAGNNSASGNITNPWKTIMYAVYTNASVLAGDTVIVNNGSYYEQPATSTYGYALKRLTLTAASPGGAIYYMNNSSTTYLLYINSDNGFVINGIVFNCTAGGTPAGIRIRQNVNNVSITNSSFISCTNGIERATSAPAYANNITISNSTFYNNSLAGISVAGGGNSITITNNIFDSSKYGVQNSWGTENITNYTLSGNVFLSTLSPVSYPAGVYVSATFPQNIVWSNNQFGSPSSYLAATAAYYLAIPDANITNNTFYLGQMLANARGIDIQNNRSYIYNNVFYGNKTNGNSLYAILAYDSENTSIINNSFTFYNGNSTTLIGGSGNNMRVENNTFNMTGPATDGIYLNPNNARNMTGLIVRNNRGYIANTSASHIIVVGNEGPSSGNWTGGIVENNYAETVNTTAVIIHDYLLGFTYNVTFRNNTAYGGRYNFVIKGNDFCNVYNNTGYNAFIGIYDKGGHNCTYSNNTIIAAGQTGYAEYLDEDPATSRQSTGSIWYNNIITGTPVTYWVSLGTNSTATIINQSIGTSESVAANASLTRQWYLTLTSSPASTFIITNSSGSVLGNGSGASYSTLITQYVTSGGVQRNSTNLTATVSATGYYSQTTTFAPTGNKQYSYTLIFRNPYAGVLNTLLVLMTILVTIAVVILILQTEVTIENLIFIMVIAIIVVQFIIPYLMNAQL